MENFMKSLRLQFISSAGWFLAFLWWDVFRIRRKVVLENISRVFPNLTEKEKNNLARASIQSMGRTVMEYTLVGGMSRKRSEWLFKVRGQEYFEQAFKKNKGVCLLTMHLGNGDLALSVLSALGYPMFLISKEFKLRWLNDLWFNLRGKSGTQFIPPRNSSYAILKALKKNTCVVFVNDQYMGPPIGAKTTFFGIETGTALGLAIMAHRSEAPVIPVYTYREKNGHHVIEFLPEIPLAETEVESTQRFNSFIEQSILKHPEQWMWVHRRWKKFE